MKQQEVICQNHRICSPPGHQVYHRQKPVRRLHNPPLKLNEWLLNVLNRLLFVAVLSEQFKMTFCDFPSFLRFCYICFIRSNLAYLCPNMIDLNVVDLSERRSEEVISFF